MDKKINLSFNKLSFGKILKNLSWVFFAAFLLLVVFEGLEIQSSIGLILQLNQTPAPLSAKKNSVDRIDFDTYNKNLQKEQGAASFTPPGGITYDPFNGIGTPQSQPASSTPPAVPVLSSSTPPQASGTPVSSSSTLP